MLPNLLTLTHISFLSLRKKNLCARKLFGFYFYSMQKLLKCSEVDLIVEKKNQLHEL